MRRIRQHRKFHLRQVPCEPSLVRMLAVSASSNNNCIQFLELVFFYRKPFYFSRAYEREIQWIEEQHDPFPFMICQLELREFPVFIRSAFEFRNFLSDLYHLPHSSI